MIAAATAIGLAALAKPVLQGYDVVAYFDLKAGDNGVLGSEQYAANITTSDLSNRTRIMPTQNYTFYFANETNKQRFLADPWRCVWCCCVVPCVVPAIAQLNCMCLGLVSSCGTDDVVVVVVA